MNADNDYPERELTEEIISAFYKVYNTLGYGFLKAFTTARSPMN